MDKLGVAVILKISRKRILVPVKWIKEIDYERVFNHGVNPSDDFTIFFSPQPEKKPNFDAPVLDVFSPDEDACYEARVFRGFGKCIFVRN